MTADRNCRARYKTPYIVTKRQWERRRANEEAEATATNYSTSKPRSRSRTPSRSHSRSRSRTPGPRKQQQRRARSRKPGRTPTRDAKATESVSFADAVKGKRATNAEAGGKTHTKIEAEIAQLTQTIQTMQMESMQAQIHAKDELIQKLQSAAHSETDQQAMQETQELIEDGYQSITGKAENPNVTTLLKRELTVIEHDTQVKDI
nr:pre-mRNA-splicing factor CWC22 homolog [Rhipicephalus microplus]